MRKQKAVIVVAALAAMLGVAGSAGSMPSLAQAATPAAQAERPRVFIASSVEGLPIAEAIAEDLQFSADVTIWDEAAFHLSEGTLAALVREAEESDFAIAVLTADDVTTSRGHSFPVARDNVIFELGLFMGHLGPERTFLVYSRDTPPTLPTDLAGITAATIDDRPNANLDAAVGPAVTEIKRAMQEVTAAEG